jgi:two-component system sensor histidine kinase HydH
MELGKRGVQSEAKLDRTMSDVYMGPEILSQLFLDLLRDILKEMDKGEALSIRTYGGDENSYVEFRSRSYQEHGKIEKELLRPFDPDEQRGDLAMSYKVLRNMGGLLSFAQDGKYRAFIVALPKSSIQEEE